MTRTTWLAASLFVVALAGCGGVGSGTADGSAGQGGPAAEAGAGGHAGVAGTNGAAGAGMAGTNGAAGAAVAGTNGAGGTGVAGAGGRAGVAGAGGRGIAGAGGAGVAGAGGRGIAGAGGAGVAGAGGRGIAGAGGAGVAGAGGAAAGGRGGAGGATVVCEDQAVCTGENCQTACGANGKATFCTCIPAGGNTMQFTCATFSCSRDAAVTPFAVCPAGVTNQPDCDLATDTICATACTAQKQNQCACVPHGGGGNGRWTCGAQSACQ